MRFVLGNVVKHEWLERFSDYVKARPRELSVVKRIIVRDFSELQERIYVAVNDATPQMLHNIWLEVEYRTGSTFPVPLMEARLRFMEHTVKNLSLHSL